MHHAIQTLYALAAALIPYTNEIRANPRLPWLARTRVAARLNHILQQLLALTARLHPTRIGATAFAPQRPSRPARQRHTTPTTPPTQNRPLSARLLATRIATLLAELDSIARETGHPLPKIIRDLAHQAKILAGCHALQAPPPRPHPTPAHSNPSG